MVTCKGQRPVRHIQYGYGISMEHEYFDETCIVLKECAPLSYKIMPTWNTGVRGLEVSDQVLPAGLDVEEIRVRDVDHAALSPGTLVIHVTQHVCRATDLVVSSEAATLSHAAVARGGHHHHLAFPAGGVELLPLAELFNL